MLKIALVSAAYPPFSFGGIDMQTYHLAHALSSAGVDVTVFCGLTEKPSVTLENIHLRIVRLPLNDFPPRVLWFQLENMGAFKGWFRDFDLVHTQHSSGSVYGLQKGKVGTPWIVSFHDHQLRRLLMLVDSKPWNLSLGDLVFYTLGYPLFESLARMELEYADHYIVCGMTGYKDYENFSKMDSGKTTLIPNSINLEKVESAARLYEETTDVKHEKTGLSIFTCGRLYASKGIQYLIEAMPAVLRDFPDARLKVCGKGPLRPFLEKLIHRLGLGQKVSLLGHVTYPQLMYEMRHCDLAVFPSLIEVGASLAVMETMSFGKPLVAFRYPFMLEIIDHLKSGYLVSPRKIRALSDGISLILADEKLRHMLGGNAREKILSKHNWEKNVNKYIDVYSRVASMKK